LSGNAHPHIYDHETTVVTSDWRSYLPEGVRSYLEPAPLAALFLGISSGATFAMIGATLTTRLAQYGIQKSAVTVGKRKRESERLGCNNGSDVSKKGARR